MITWTRARSAASPATRTPIAGRSKVGRVGVALEAVRTFVAVAEAGQFQKAAADLSITQQAVSKRIAALKRTVMSGRAAWP